MLRIGIIGIGHWGPNYARILNGQVAGATLTACVDKVPARLNSIRAQYPQVEMLTDHREMETLTITDRNYIICDGRVLVSGDSKTVLSHEEAQRAYFGKRSYHAPGMLGGDQLVA